MIRRGFRDQHLSTAPRQRARLLEAEAVAQEQLNGMRGGPASIIGGVRVEAGDTAGYNAANAQREEVGADANARMRLQGQFGSSTVTRGKPGGLRGGTQLGVASAGAGQGSLLEHGNDAVGAGKGALLEQGGGVPAPDYPNATYNAVMSGAPSKPKPDIMGGTSTRAGSRRLRAQDRSDDRQGGYGIDTGGGGYPDYGYANGGEILKKPKMVNQPGMTKTTGKVRMPPNVPRGTSEGVRAPGNKWGTEPQPVLPEPQPEPMPTPGGNRWGRDEQGMRGYGNGGPVITADPRTRSRAYEEEVLLGDQSRAGFRAASEKKQYNRPKTQLHKDSDSDKRFDAREGTRNKKAMDKLVNSAKPGMMAGGPIGEVAEDDGKDTVDVRTREGEYLLNPETVAAGFGGGDYNAGVQALDQIVTQSTGEEPGPIPVNEDGEAVRGFKNGGGVRMGFEAGGTMFVDPAGKTVQVLDGQPMPKNGSSIIPEADARANLRNQRFTAAGEKFGKVVKNNPAAKATINAASKVRNFAGMGGGAVVAPAVMGGLTVADNMTGAKDAYYNDPDVDAWEKAKLAYGEVQSTALPAAGTVVGAAGGSVVGTPMVGGVLGGVGGFTAGALADRGLRNLVGAPAEGTEEFNEYAANWTPEQVEEAAAAGLPPEQYFRSFSNEAVDMAGAQERGLRSAAEAVAPGGMNIVQNTGGPGNEVITREDMVQPDGSIVPSFTNMRQTEFDGSARNLQAQADQRVVDNAAIDQRNTAFVDGLRDSAPLYNKADVDQRRGEQRASAATASKGATAKRVATDKRIDERFMQPTFDKDGNPKGQAPNIEMRNAFNDTMAIMGVDIYGADEATQNKVFEQFGDVYTDLTQANSAAKAQGLPISMEPRTGDNSLRRFPETPATKAAGRRSNIGLGNVWGPEATMGDWWAGVGNDDPINDEFIIDPKTGARIPALRALRKRGDTMKAREDYGYQ